MDKANMCCKMGIGAYWTITSRKLMGMSYVPGLARGCHIGSSPACYVVVGLN